MSKKQSNKINTSIPELWMIWDTNDGDEIIIESKDYVEFCKYTEREFWGFDVTKVQMWKPRSECKRIDTYKLNMQVDKELKVIGK